MKKLFSILATFLLLPNFAFANPQGAVCGVQGDGDFTIAFNVRGDNSGHSVVLDQGNHGYVLWYTDPNEIPTNYASSLYERIFYESKLDPARFYNILITHDTSKDVLNYYRKLDSELESSYVLIDTRKLDLKTGKHWVLGSDVGIERCSSQVEPPPLPPTPTPEPDLEQICRYFPEPAQGWSDQNSVSKLTVTNGNSNTQLKNWSVAYRNAFTFEKDTIKKPLLRTGFALLVDEGGNAGGDDAYWQVYENNVCETSGCEVGNDDNELYRREIAPPESVVLDTSSNTALTITNSINENYFTDVCEAPVCTYSEYGDETTLYIHENLKSLNVTQRIPGRIIIKPDNGIHIGELSMAKQVDLYMRTSHTLTVGKLNTSEQTSSMTFEDDVRINVASQFYASNKVDFNRVNDSVNVFMYGPSAEFTFNETNSDFYGFILANRISFENPITIHGSVTAQHLVMKKDVVIQKPDYSCPLPPVSDVETFIVEPQWKYGLTCERIPVDFKLVNEQSQLVDSDASFRPLVSPSNGALWCSGETGDNCGIGVANLFDGEKTLYLSVQDVGEYMVGANYDYESYSGGSVKFVPYKLHVTPSLVEMIAGEDASVSVQALSCDGDQAKVVENYNSSLAMSLDNYELEKPNTGSLYDFNVSDLQFTNGYADATVSWQDVGQTKVVFEDANFDCRDYEQEGENLACPIDGGVLKGEFTVKSRPWKIVACNIVAKNGGKTNPATQATGGGFIASAESFNVTYKPVVHSDSRGNATNVCDYPLTQNYFSDANTTAPLGVEFSVLYPSDGDIANLATATDDSSNLDFSSEEAKTGKTLEYAWDEAGSLNLKTTATYLGMDLDEDDEVTVGRFYPKYFKVVASTWDYPGDQVFAYMDQPFDGVDFSVEALNADKVAIKNYAIFTTKAEFNLDEIDSYSDRFDTPDFGAGTWNTTSGRSIGNFSIGNNSNILCGANSLDNTKGSACWNKDLGGHYPDGPFNSVVGTDTSEIGLVYTDNADPVEYIIDDDKGTNSRLVVQPDIRFGRVNLDDVGGRQGETLHVPLRVEYWNGSRFVVNSNDSQTDVNGIKWEQKHIWPTGTDAAPKDVNLADGGEVSSGSSRSVTATQTDSYRQQTRVWLDLEANDLPWLKYDWEKESAGEVPAEENPSSVVTFGIHRGNDRVIYRGEPGLTAQ